MYSQKLIERLVKLLAPEGYTPRIESEATYPVRSLPDSAEVMRVPPSPTGFVHIGTIYAGLINERIAHQSNGIFILRIEDTDKKREVTGSVDAITHAFSAFDVPYDEGPDAPAAYGPYFQSERAKIYLGYAIELLEKGHAYPCFATLEELELLTKDQQAKKQRPGYYGEWAIWRNKSEEDITKALDAGLSFVLRFKSNGSHEKRISYTDVFKGNMEVPENDLDVPLIKSDAHRLPTYHLAHVVDDHLMRTTKVFRSDEWLPSTSLHIELAESLGIEPFQYGHFAPISILDTNGNKRKLSKRKDDEADVQFWLALGYPIEAVKAYLLGLANSNFEDWYRANPDKSLTDFTVSLEKLAASRAPLLDMKKLEDYAKDYIANLPLDKFVSEIKAWAQLKERAFFEAIASDANYSEKVFAIERDGDKPRKDLSKWADAPEQYGYFFDELYTQHFLLRIDTELDGLEKKHVQNVCDSFTQFYDPADDQDTWLSKFREAANSQQMKLGDYAKIIRVLLTGKNRSPDLYAVLHVMGPERVAHRLNIENIS